MISNVNFWIFMKKQSNIIEKREKQFLQDAIIILPHARKFVLLHRVSLIRPAPAELPQDRKVARVGGCSGAI